MLLLIDLHNVLFMIINLQAHNILTVAIQIELFMMKNEITVAYKGDTGKVSEVG